MSGLTDAQVKVLEEAMTDELQAAARAVNAHTPHGWGFAVLMFEFTEEPGGPLLYVSNAMREDIVKVMGEFIARQDATLSAEDPRERMKKGRG